jgi:hypothetical protein
MITGLGAASAGWRQLRFVELDRPRRPPGVELRVVEADVGRQGLLGLHDPPGSRALGGAEAFFDGAGEMSRFDGKRLHRQRMARNGLAQQEDPEQLDVRVAIQLVEEQRAPATLD